MKIYKDAIQIKTSEGNPFHNITNQVAECVRLSGIKHGLCHIYSKHTTLSVKITEDEGLMHIDCAELLEQVAPYWKNYRHDNLEERNVPKTERINGKSHLKQLFMNTSETVPVTEFILDLGQWQNIFVVELDPARDRLIEVMVMGE